MIQQLLKTTFLILLVIQLGNSQSLHDLPPSVGHDGLSEIKYYNFKNVDVDAEGNPILVFGSADITVSRFKNGQLESSTMYNSMHEKEMEFINTYTDGLKTKVEIFSYRMKKKDLFKWYQIFYKGGQISHENIYYDENEFRGSVNYNHGVNDNGHRTVKAELYRSDETNLSGGYDFVYDENDVIIKKVGHTVKDTGLIMNVTEIIGDSIFISTITNKQRNGQSKWVNVESKMTNLKRQDHNGLPTFELMKIEGYDLQSEEDKVIYMVTVMENTYNDGTVTGGLKAFTMQGLSGSYYNENDNVIITLGTDGSCAIDHYDESTKDKESLVSTDSWGYEILVQGTCEYNIKENTISFGGSIKEDIHIEHAFDRLILRRPKDEERYSDWEWVTLDKLK